MNSVLEEMKKVFKNAKWEQTCKAIEKDQA